MEHAGYYEGVPPMESPREEEEQQEDLSLWYKDRADFAANFEKYAKSVDISKINDNDLVEIYASTQDMLAHEMENRDNAAASPERSRQILAEGAQEHEVEPRFEFLGRLRDEIDKREGRLRAKGIAIPPTMKERGL